MNSASRTVPPLLAAMLLVMATTACQREAEDIMATPSDDISAATPINTTPADAMPVDRPPLPPPQTESCAGLIGAELDGCLRRPIEQATPPPSEQLPPMQGDTPTPPQPSPY